MEDTETNGFRLVNSKFPPIALFDDVADAEDFEALYQLQAMTNPRLRSEVGDLNLIPREEIPFGIAGCAYATAPFTHVNPDGGRFNDGQYGVLYMADSFATAIAEVAYHQTRYWQGVHGLQYDRFVFRGLVCRFGTEGVKDACSLPMTDPIYDRTSYAASRECGRSLRKLGVTGIQFLSVRRAEAGAICWGLFTPKQVYRIHQSCHYEFVWTGEAIGSISKVSRP
ncbi:MAG: RES family NAD+ phosphorylase [Marinobacter sp.]|uniref:RES family NAD+ phosphorylase n=1 Tax=Marinobacter sp. TaxID=50741 RepID=UPI00299D14B3|nr:RES family NAD+ phosphorylase [Marinobacter sp.]MDX1755574.1 RES family NAD+ phosphorylase [Marinobacter sp.]